MNPTLRVVHGDGGPPDDEARLVAALRDLLAPPGGADDVAALEARIMASVRGESDPFAILPRWARPALAAAAAASLILAGAAEGQARHRDQRVAVMAMVGVPRDAAQSNIPGAAAREATLRSLLEQ